MRSLPGHLGGALAAQRGHAGTEEEAGECQKLGGRTTWPSFRTLSSGSCTATASTIAARKTSPGCSSTTQCSTSSMSVPRSARIQLLSRRQVAAEWGHRRDLNSAIYERRRKLKKKKRVDDLRARAIGTGSPGQWREKHLRAPQSSPSFERSDNIDQWVELLGRAVRETMAADPNSDHEQWGLRWASQHVGEPSPVEEEAVSIPLKLVQEETKSMRP